MTRAAPASLLAMAVLFSACTTVYVEEPDLSPCEDLTVGDRAEWFGFRVRGGDLPEEAIAAEWILTGPGNLEEGPPESGRPPEERATYTATEPGAATVLARLTEYDVPNLPINLGISSRARVFERRCTFEVSAGAAAQPPPTTAPVTGAEHVYDVTQLVTRSDTGLGLGNEAEVEWVWRFDCGDGRCGGGLSTGGSPFHDVAYQPESETFTISLDETRSNDDACPTGTVTGTITVTAWDERGPVEFTATRQAVLDCDSGALATEFADTGLRR